MQVKAHYEDFWSKHKDDFEYDRNLSLPQFFKEGEKVLDVGCGDGTVALYLKQKKNLKISGIDISQKAVTFAKAKGLKALVFNAEGKFPFKDDEFEAVFWGDNIEHLFDPIKTALEIKRVLMPGGRVILSCPNMGYWRYRIHYFLKGSLADTEWTGFPPWYWSHIRFFNLKIIQRFLKEAGFKFNKFIGVSSRRLDKPFVGYFPSIFGMIMIVEAYRE